MIEGFVFSTPLTMSRSFASFAILIPTALAGSLSLPVSAAASQAIDLGQKHFQLAQQPVGQWGLVLGADDTLEKALYEVKSARRNLSIEPAIFKCGSWFRTVGVFKDRNTSLLYLSRARRSSRYKPYVVEMKSWCPSKQLVPFKG